MGRPAIPSRCTTALSTGAEILPNYSRKVFLNLADEVECVGRAFEVERSPDTSWSAMVSKLPSSCVLGIRVPTSRNTVS